MSTRLYVGNLSYDTTEQELQDLFSQAGSVTNVSLPTDRATGRIRGFGFVEMGSDNDAQEAIRKFNGYVLRDRQLTVNEARPARSATGAATVVAVAVVVAVVTAAVAAVVVAVVTAAAAAVAEAAGITSASERRFAASTGLREPVLAVIDQEKGDAHQALRWASSLSFSIGRG